MNNIYSSVVIGLGRIGALYPSKKIPRNHTAAYINHQNINLIAGIDPDPQARSQFKRLWGEDIKLFSSIDEMFNAGLRPDIVSICTSPDEMQKNVKSFNSYKPKIFFLEKPAISSEEQCIELELSLNNTPAAINYHRCWDPKHKKFFKKINSKKIFSSRVLYSKGLFNYGSHMIALLIQNFGDVHSVTRILSDKNTNKIDDISESFIINFERGFSTIFQGIEDLDYDLLELDVITDDGIYSLKSGGCRERHEVPTMDLFYENYSSLGDAMTDEEDGQVEGLSQAIENIVNFLDKKNNKLECDLKSAINVYKIINQITNKSL